MRRTQAALLAAVARLNPDRTEVLRRVAAVDAWTGFTGLARAHGLGSLAPRNLADVPGLPVEVAVDLGQQARVGARRSLMMAARLVELQSALRAADVETVPFKGPTLAAAVYGDVGLRWSVDLDLLVRSADVSRARACLGSLGFIGGPALARSDEFTRYNNEFTLWHPEEHLVVDLTWAAAPSHFAMPLAFEPMWGRLTTVRVGDSEVSTLGAEDLLVMLLAHGGKHLWERLIWICDVAELIEGRPDIDWDAVGARLRSARMQRLGHVGLRLAARCRPGLGLPESVIRDLRSDAKVERLAHELWRRCLIGDPSEEGPPVRTLDLRLREDPRDRVAYLWRLATTPTWGDWEWIDLHGRRSWAYVALRPIRLLSKYGGGVFR